MNPPAGSVEASVTDSSIGPDGATAAQVQQALDESGLSVNGSGIRVGVLSDSFNDLGGAAADEADGALPPAADIDVIKDLASGGTDEGRAMMQIIHDIAPGARSRLLHRLRQRAGLRQRHPRAGRRRLQSHLSTT